MSAEERITKIENLLQTLVESQVHFQAQAAEIQARAAEYQARAAEYQARAAERHAKADAEIAELWRFSKASDERLDRHIEFVAASISQTEQQIAKTAAAQEVTEQMMQRLISRVDKIEGQK